MEPTLEFDNRFIMDVKNKHIWILRKMHSARTEYPSRLLRRCEIMDGAVMPRGSFNRIFDRMIKSRIVRLVLAGNKKYYEPDQLGLAMLNELLPLELLLPVYEATLRITKERR